MIVFSLAAKTRRLQGVSRIGLCRWLGALDMGRQSISRGAEKGGSFDLELWLGRGEPGGQVVAGGAESRLQVP